MIIKISKIVWLIILLFIVIAAVIISVIFQSKESPTIYDKEFPEVSVLLNQQIETKQETRAMWLSYIELTPILKNRSEEEFTSSYKKILENMKGLGLNTIIVQVRPFSDALYDSDYFPWSHIITGQQGKTPAFDPLKIMVQCTHEYGLKIEAWINPFRIRTSPSLNLCTDNMANKWYNSSLKGLYVVEVGNGLYYNPAYQEVSNLVIQGVGEIVDKYSVDGIHLDDYFYPTTDKTFDQDAYQNYLNDQGSLSLSDWRLNNINRIVKSIYNTIKSKRDSVVFGISPQANISVNYTEQFADIKLWMMEKGYLDYICPQVYFGFSNETQPFSKVVDDWSSLERNKSVSLYIGFTAHKIGKEDSWAGSGKGEWLNTSDILYRMLSDIRLHKEISGFAIYSYKYLFEPTTDVMVQVNAEKENLKSLLN